MGSGGQLGGSAVAGSPGSWRTASGSCETRLHSSMQSLMLCGSGNPIGGGSEQIKVMLSVEVVKPKVCP